MTAVPLGFALLFAAGGTLVMISAFILYAMIGKVNQKLPEDQYISYAFFYPSKVFRITREYKRLYPHSRLNTVRIILNIAGGILVIASAAWLNRLLR